MLEANFTAAWERAVQSEADNLSWQRWRWSAAAMTVLAVHLAGASSGRGWNALAVVSGVGALLALFLRRGPEAPRGVQPAAALCHMVVIAAASGAGPAGPAAVAGVLLSAGWTIVSFRWLTPVLGLGVGVSLAGLSGPAVWAPAAAALAAVAIHLEAVRSARSLADAQDRIGRERKDGSEQTARVRRRLEHLEQVYRKAPVGLALVTERFLVVRVNERLAALCASAGDDNPVGRRIRDALPAIGERVEAICATVLQRNRPHLDLEFAIRGSGAEGARHWLVSGYPLELEEGVGVSLVIEEITERKRDQQRVLDVKERYELAARGANDGLWDWDFRTNIMYFSPRWKAMLGAAEDDISDDPDEWASRVHPEDLAHLRLRLREHLEGHTPHFECEYRILHREGAHRWMLARGVAIRDGRGEACRMAGSQTDISERKSYEQRLVESAAHDALTGLPNRLLLSERLGRALARVRRDPKYRFALLFLDLDRFKVINDSLGHLAGDELLVIVSKRLAKTLRGSDTIARIGGDEFTIIAEEIDSERDAVDTAERVLSELDKPVVIAGEEVRCSASIGIAISPRGVSTPEELLRNADLALYRAKARGRGRWALYREEMHRRVVQTMTLETALRKALECDEIEAWFQPICSVADGAVIGCEALARWRTADGRLIRPAEFIPAAEECGAIVQIDGLMLRHACRQIRLWRDAGLPPIPVAVNVSARQLREPQFSAQVEAALTEYRLEPRVLELELTESVLIEDIESGAETLRRLADRGVRIALDDFGTGYSSLSYLHRFRLDTLKISQQFIHDVESDPTVAAITRGVIDLAHSIGLRVVAEAVETQGQLRFLQERQCDAYQGALMSWPVEPERMTEILRERADGPLPRPAQKVG